MANWARDFLEQSPELARLPIAGRGRYSLHFREGGQRLAFFTGMPCHWWNGREWVALDTNLVWDATRNVWGAPGIRTVIDGNGGVTVGGYSQRTGRVGLLDPETRKFIALARLEGGGASGDSFIREAGGFRHIITLQEDGVRETLVLLEKPPLGDGAGTLLATETVARGKARLHFCPPAGWDAAGRVAPIQCHVIGKWVYVGIPAWWLEGAVYPVTLDPDFAGHTGSGYVEGENTTYSTARSTATGINTYNALYVGQWFYYAGNFYTVMRTFLKFDTSGIPDDVSISQTNLGLTVIDDSSYVDFDVQIVKQDWSGQDPLSTSNMDTAYDNCLSGTADSNIWRNTNGISLNTRYWSGDLSTAWPSKTSYTYYSLRSSREKAGYAPGDPEYVGFAKPNHATESYRPVLRIIYKLPYAVDGGWSGAGAIKKRTAAAKSGGFSNDGVLAKCTGKFFAGAWSGIGGLRGKVLKALAGAWSGDGVLGKLKTHLVSLAGAWSSIGELKGKALKSLAGDWSGAGALGYVKPFLKSIAGITGFRGVIRHKHWWRRLCAWLRLD